MQNRNTSQIMHTKHKQQSVINVTKNDDVGRVSIQYATPR